MARLLTMSILLLCPLLAPAQDSIRIARLEQEVRQLQREVLTLSQLVSQLRARADAPAAPAAPPAWAPSPGAGTAAQPDPHTPEAARWVSASRWRNLRPGMSDLEVISELGPPTSTRGRDPELVLLYALEIGTSSFLAGSVTLRDHVVVAVETPTLK